MQNKIPKIIHYCWFGGKPMPELAIKCIESWKKHLPDYELKLWNESTFDLASNLYANEAYQAKKYAFVTDYVRLFAIYHFGGIYMDTDVEVLKGFDDLLDLPAFSGFESDIHVPTGIMASQKHGQWAMELLDYYNNRHFIMKNGSYDTTTNVIIISGIMKKGGFKLDNTLRDYKGLVRMYPTEYFCPKSLETGEIIITPNTYCIHHFSASWLTPRDLRIIKLKKKIKSLIGPIFTALIVRIKRRITNLL